MKKLKMLWIKLLVTVVSVALMLGCFGGFAFADTVNEASGDNGFLHENGTIVSRVEFDKSFTIPAPKGEHNKVKVTNPAGEDITKEKGSDKEYEYHAVNPGNYKVTYYNEDDDISYTYTVYCYESADFFIYVENNGAGIPTYIGLNGQFTLPEWSLAKLDDDGNLVKLTEADDVETSWKLNGSVQNQKAHDKVTISTPGSQIVTLIAKFKGTNKTYSQEYTVVCQNGFTDTKAPTILNIANLPSSASINTVVTLPKATANDDYDENVLINVSVTDPDGNAVKDVNVNDQGYAYEELTTERKFDNDRVTTFYPRKEGTYVVAYSATDDAGNVSPQHTYKISVSDRTGPVIVDVSDDAIPTVWGLNSVEDAEGNTLEGANLDIKIPLPEVVDNSDTFVLDEAENAWTGGIKMTVEVKNPENTVARFASLTVDDIKNGKEIDATNGDEQYRKYYKNDEAGVRDYGVAIVSKDGGRPYLKLNFNDFFDGETDGTKTKAALTGDWTITFSFRDKNSNGGYSSSQKVYTINVAGNVFEDESAPSITEPTLPEYIIAGGDVTTYTVPQIEVKDDKDSRLTIKYELVTKDEATEGAGTTQGAAEGETDGETTAGEHRLAVEGGEELEIYTVTENDTTKYYLGRSEEERIELFDGKDIELVYSATDDAKNIAELKKGEEENYKFKVYIAKSGYDEKEVDFDIIDTDTEETKIKANTDSIQYVGGFTVKGITQKEFVGYEVSVKDSDDNYINVVSYSFFADDNLYVKNIGFNPAKGGDYELAVRVFDAKGNSFVYVKKIAAVFEASETGRTIARNATSAWEYNGETGETYPLRQHDYTIQGTDETVQIYGIEGTKYSRLGNDFTAYNQGKYIVTEYTATKADVVELTSEKSDEFLTKLVNRGREPIEVTDDSSVTFDIDGSIPSYLDKFSRPANENKYQPDDDKGKYYYVTDPIVAYSETRNFDVTITYTDPNGDANDAFKVYEYKDAESGNTVYTFDSKADGAEFKGRFALKLYLDGTYSLNVKAGGNNKTYTIKVGDIVAPQFSFKGEPRTTATVNSTDAFAYADIDLDKVNLGDGEAESSVRVLYRLYEPGSSSNVSDVSGEITYAKLKENGGKIKLTNDYFFTKSGDYRVEVIFVDKAGNQSVQRYTVTVTTATSKTPRSLTMLSTVLIIVGVLLIIGVVIYLIRFRKHRA